MNICGIQRFIRKNAEDLISNKNSFVYRSSLGSQQMECWWSILRRSRVNWWINVFKDMSAENFVDTRLPVEDDFYFKSDNVNLTLGYSPIVMSMSLSCAYYSLCVNKYGAQ